MKNYVWVKINLKNKDKVLLRCYKRKISIHDSYSLNEYFYLKLDSKDLKKFKKYSYVRYTKDKDTGINYLKECLYKYRFYIIGLFLGVILFQFLSNVIVSVEVIHSNKEIRNLIINSLDDMGIKKNTLKKNYQEIQKIKEDILNKYPDRLEWLEIEVKGMKYIVKLEERKLKINEQEKVSCDVVAKKDGIVKQIIYSKGISMVHQNSYVKKGDVLISGKLMKDENTISNVCAQGDIYAEVWYKVNVSMPTSKIEKKKTGKKRWNFKIKNNYIDKVIFKSRIENFERSEKKLVTLFNTTIYLLNEEEVEEEIVNLNEKELEDRAMIEVKEKVSGLLNDKEKIINEKVLKKELNDSKMLLEVFVAVLENISTVQEF